jgi:hypothetical protein
MVSLFGLQCYPTYITRRLLVLLKGHVMVIISQLLSMGEKDNIPREGMPGQLP